MGPKLFHRENKLRPACSLIHHPLFSHKNQHITVNKMSLHHYSKFINLLPAIELLTDGLDFIGLSISHVILTSDGAVYNSNGVIQIIGLE